MIKNNLYNSSGKVIGYIIFQDDLKEIEIHSTKNPVLKINNEYVLKFSLSRKLDLEIIKYLYDELTLSQSEIAGILDLQYHKVNKFIKINQDKFNTGVHEGRRNSSYGHTFSKERILNISKANSNKVIYNNGIKEHAFKIEQLIPDGWVKGRLPFSNDHRAKIRQVALDGKYLSPKEIACRGWENGKFDNVNFKRGIAGYFTSIKIGKRLFFRSLLELYYAINYLEEDNNVSSYTYESLRIKCDDGTLYTPDYIIDNKIIIEVKSKRFIYKQGGKIQQKFEYKKEQAEKYCSQNNLIYKVVFDEDINFRYDVLLNQLREGKYIEKYKIEFLQPERVWSRK